jgi:hypothetical protein
MLCLEQQACRRLFAVAVTGMVSQGAEAKGREERNVKAPSARRVGVILQDGGCWDAWGEVRKVGVDGSGDFLLHVRNDPVNVNVSFFF